MKTDSSEKTPVVKINRLIGSLGGSEKNKISGIFLNETLMEFILLENSLTIPPMPVGELDYRIGAEIAEKLISVIPEYLFQHTLLEKRKPSSEQHSLQFIKAIPGRLVDFVHVLRFDFKLSGGDGIITGKGSNNSFPQYSTEKIRYKSRLVPVIKGSDPGLIDSVRIKSQLEVDSDGKRFTSVFFDEYSTAEISIDFSLKAGSGIFSVPAKIYPFISYDYFTACLNIPDPEIMKIEKGVSVYEPLFLFLYYQYRERNFDIDKSSLDVWKDYLNVSGPEVTISEQYKDILKDFFSCYTLYRDDDLLLKGLRRIDIG
jgi:hypothetical protein